MGVLFTGGLMALGAGVANAADNGLGTDGSHSVLGGTQAISPLSLPVTVGENAVSVLGDAGSSGSAAATPAGGAGSASSGAGTSGANGAASGTQVVAPIAVPVTVGGNAVSVLG
ncbi:MAG: cell wall anchor protein, partial [Micrococcales bacterium]|nr:cell wall anchor protein [Micrococcales bacterium]